MNSKRLLLPVLAIGIAIGVTMAYTNHGSAQSPSLPEFFKPENMQKVHYILIDWERRAEMLGLPHKWPSPDPIEDAFRLWPTG